MNITPVNYTSPNRTKPAFGINIESIEPIAKEAYDMLGEKDAMKFLKILGSKKTLKKIDKLLLSTGENANISISKTTFSQNIDHITTEIGYLLKATPLRSKSSDIGSKFIFHKDTPKRLVRNFIVALKESIYGAEHNAVYVKEKILEQSRELDKKLKASA